MTDRATQRLAASERRDQLLRAARDTFGQNGFANTSMNDVAVVAGITKPVLYQHFESKHELFLEVLMATSAELVRRIETTVTQADSPRQKVESAAHEYVSFFAQEPSRFNVLFGEGVRSDARFRQELLAIEQAIVSSTAEHISIDGFGEAERFIVAQAISGLLEAATRRWMQDRSIDASAAAKLMSDLAWRGLRGIEATN